MLDLNSFAQHSLEEDAAWTKSASEHIFRDDVHLPLSSNMYKRIFGKKPPRMTVFHVTNPKYLEDMIKLQGKKKSISALTHAHRDIIAGGINVSGGIVFQVEADILLSAPHDIMSRPDKTGRRWLEMFYLASVDANLARDMTREGEKEIRGLLEKYLGHKVSGRSVFKLWPQLDPRNEKSPIAPHHKFSRRDKNMAKGHKQIQVQTGKLLHSMVKDYIDAMERIMKKYEKPLAEVLWKHSASPIKNQNTNPWDEYVVNRIQIQKVLIDRETIQKAFGGKRMEDWEREEYFDHFLSELSDNNIKYEIFDNATQVAQEITTISGMSTWK